MENGVLSHTNMVTQAHLGEATHKFIKIDEWPLQVQSVTLWITPYRTTCCSETDQNGVEGQNIYVMGEKIWIKKIVKAFLLAHKSTCSNNQNIIPAQRQILALLQESFAFYDDISEVFESWSSVWWHAC